MNELTPKQARFVEEFLVDFNATQAAVRAGYSRKTARQVGAENLSKPVISAEIKRRTIETGKRLEATRERVLDELVRLAFSDIKNVAKWGRVEVKQIDSETGEAAVATIDLDLIPSDEIPKDVSRAISEIRKTRDGLVIKMHNKLPALEKLARHLGLDTPDEDDTPKRIEIHWLPPRNAIGEPEEERPIAA
jgi:phage terminase small subunit